mmetsp:Transcript_51405/g.116904  ORF Transcript_51405/g.116904 Transcript_51405/m.116904 type:complete len:381 (-) Transcript_51405:228-1370(-)
MKGALGKVRASRVSGGAREALLGRPAGDAPGGYDEFKDSVKALREHWQAADAANTGGACDPVSSEPKLVRRVLAVFASLERCPGGQGMEEAPERLFADFLRCFVPSARRSTLEACARERHPGLARPTNPKPEPRGEGSAAPALQGGAPMPGRSQRASGGAPVAGPTRGSKRARLALGGGASGPETSQTQEKPRLTSAKALLLDRSAKPNAPDRSAKLDAAMADLESCRGDPCGRSAFVADTSGSGSGSGSGNGSGSCPGVALVRPEGWSCAICCEGEDPLGPEGGLPEGRPSSGASSSRAPLVARCGHVACYACWKNWRKSDQNKDQCRQLLSLGQAIGQPSGRQPAQKAASMVCPICRELIPPASLRKLLQIAGPMELI